MKRRFWLRLLIVLLLIAGLEIALRFFGFGSYPIYYESDVYEYAFVPSQSLKRFGNAFYINELGMRSSEIQPGQRVVMGFGDSVFNGGVALSQDELASTIIDSALKKQYNNTRFTNTSAGSWGVSNAFYWLQSKEIQNPLAIVLVFSSHDYDDKMEFQDVVGEIPFYPDSQPVSAITDALNWVYSRYFEKIQWSELKRSRIYSDNDAEYDSGWIKFIEYSRSKNVPLIVYHHPNLSESLNGEWNKKGKKLEKLLSANGVKSISGLRVKMQEEDYRDEIHTSASGQLKIANAILPVVMSHLSHEK